jgi:spore cortex formation protein SpoVR/YcgB (stage V sporulation)
MGIQENKRKELEHILSKENFVKVTGAIKMLRDQSPFVGAIGLLVAYYNKSDNDSIKRLIRDFLNDLKYQSSCNEVITEIKKDIKPDTLRMLISSCWQSGLDYADNSSDFADLFLTADYMTAIECFTVLESSVQKMTKKKRDEIIKTIRDGTLSAVGEKKALSLELISVLE